MPTYKLTYFNMMGRAEAARLIFAYAGQEFEDNRIDKERWAKMKPTMLFGQIPALEVDGKVLTQSQAINRYLGKVFGLLGKDAWEEALCDQYVDGLSDALNNFKPVFMENDPAKKKELMAKCIQEFVVPLAAKYDKILAETKNGHFVGDKMTWADLTLFHGFGFIFGAAPELNSLFPNIKNFLDKTAAEPKIKAYLEKRPVTPM